MGYYRTVTNDASDTLPRVAVAIVGASNVTCFTIEERLPVLATPVEIDGGGRWLPDLSVVRWGPYTNVPTVTVGYRVSGPPGAYTVGGVGWADGRWKFEPPDSTVAIPGAADSTTPTTPAQVATPLIAPLALQAESASFIESVNIVSTNTGFNGSGFAVFPGAGGVLEFSQVNGGAGGAATLSIRYALGAGSPRAGWLIVNGVTNDITFNPMASWTNWAVLTQRVTLTGGPANRLRFESTGEGLANLDEITVSPDGPAVEADVVMSCATPGATVHYTLDGTLPTQGSTVYAAPLHLVTPGVVRARAFLGGWRPSVASTANYGPAPIIGPAALVRSVEASTPWAPVMNLNFAAGTVRSVRHWRRPCPPNSWFPASVAMASRRTA